MNKIHLVGVIASEIKVNEYPAKEGGEVWVKASFLLGVRRPSSNGERKGDLIRVEAWGLQARNLAQYNSVRSRVGVTGRLRSEFYNPDGVPKGGQLRSSVVADQIEYLTPKQPAAVPGDATVAEEQPVAKASRR
jgi:single-stranded DNA-binding protein